MVSPVNAIGAYNKAIQASQVDKNYASSEAMAPKFQELVATNFNKLSRMTPSEVLSYVNSMRASGVSGVLPNDVAHITSAVNSGGNGIVKHMRETVGKFESSAHLEVLGQGNSIETALGMKEAKALLDLLRGIRDKMNTFFSTMFNLQM